MRLRYLPVLPIVLAWLTAAPAALATTAGQVIFATGQVTAERTPPVPLAKGDDVFVADTVRTGSASRAQLRLLDGAKIALRPESALRIEEFLFQAEAANGQAAVATRGDRSVTSLLKGGFRTITGAIGKDDEREYEVRTPVGVLGIRGTDYTAVFCNADCAGAPGATSTPPEDGLYLGVAEGIIFFRNEYGDLELRAGEYAFIPLVTRRPQRLSMPPAILVDGPENDPVAGRGAAPAGFDSRLGSRRRPRVDGQTDAADGGAGDDSDVPEQPVTGRDADGSVIDLTPGQDPQRPPPPPGNRSISWSSGPLSGVQGFPFSGVDDNAPGQYVTDANGDLLGFVAPYPALRQAAESATFDINTATFAETGGDATTFLRWGRWAGGTAGIVLASGGAVDQDLGSQSLHWVASPDWMAPPVMPVTGSASYSLLGASAPTDALGNSGVLGSATFDVDFTNFLVTSTLDLTVNQRQWLASGSGTLGNRLDPPRAAHLFEGTYQNVVVDGVTGGAGLFSGFFSEPGPTSDPAFPGGVGLTYTLQDPGGQDTVSGAAAFGNP